MQIPFPRWVLSAITVLVGLAAFWGCASPTPTPVPTATPTPPPGPTATPVPVTGPIVVAFDDIVVELVVPEEVPFSALVLFQLALGNAGTTTRTLYHGADLAEFILTKDGEQVMTSFDQQEFGDVRYTNELGPARTRRFETGFTTGVFEGVLIDTDFQPLPVGEYQVYGIAHMGLTEPGDDEEFVTPPTTIRIVPAK